MHFFQVKMLSAMMLELYTNKSCRTQNNSNQIRISEKIRIQINPKQIPEVLRMEIHLTDLTSM